MNAYRLTLAGVKNGISVEFLEFHSDPNFSLADQAGT
jgi:hypothetical protein